MSLLVADFGEAFIVQDSTNNAGGTFSYMAPERFTLGKITNKSDLWSCGVIIYEMIHLKRPFKDRDEILNKIDLNFNDKKIAKELKPLLEE